MNLTQHDIEAVFCLAHFRYLIQLTRKGRRNTGHARGNLAIERKSEAELVKLVGGAMVSRINSGTVIKMQGRDRRLHT